MKHGVGALFWLILALPAAVGADNVARGPHQLWRRMENENGRRMLFNSLGHDEFQLAPEHRTLKLFQADVAECKRFCQRNYDDVIGYKCSVRLAVLL